MTPTTAAVMAVSGAVSLRLPWVVSIKGPPIKMKTKLGRKVKKVTMEAAISADANALKCVAPVPNQPPTNPTNVLTITKGPGVVSPKDKASIICVADSHW